MCTICTGWECGPPHISPEQAVVSASVFLSQSCCPLGTLCPLTCDGLVLVLKTSAQGPLSPRGPQAPAVSTTALHFSLLHVVYFLPCIATHSNYMLPVYCLTVCCSASRANLSLTGHELHTRAFVFSQLRSHSGNVPAT